MSKPRTESKASSMLYTGSEGDYSIYNCKYCLYGTNTIEALRRHERTHPTSAQSVRKELKYPHNCDFCNSKFVQKKELDEHRKKHAIGMSCSLCSYTSPNRNNLKNHVRSHGNKRSFKCLLCCERMTSRKMLDDHVNNHVLTLSSCKWCRFTTDTPSRLKAHFQLHMKTKQINCDSCGYFCFEQSDLEAHRELHAGGEKKPADIPAPPKTVPEPAKLGEEGKRPKAKTDLDWKRMLKRAFFKCSICGALLKSDASLRSHGWTHVQQQRYSCHICSFAGKDREEIMNHLIDHLPVVDLSSLEK